MPAAAEWSAAGELLVVFGRVGAVGFGGGQAMIPIIEVACVPGPPASQPQVETTGIRCQ